MPIWMKILPVFIVEFIAKKSGRYSKVKCHEITVYQVFKDVLIYVRDDKNG